MAHTPFTYGICVTFIVGTYNFQIAVNISTGKRYAMRSDNGTWEYLDYNFPAFYKDYSTLNALAAGLGGDITFNVPSDGNWSSSVNTPAGLYSCVVKNASGQIVGTCIIQRELNFIVYIQGNEGICNLTYYVTGATFGPEYIGFKTNSVGTAYTVVIRRISAS